MRSALRTAVVRGFRTSLQTFVALLIALPTAEALPDVAIQASNILIAAWAAFVAGLVAFAQNLGELLTDAPVPRG